MIIQPGMTVLARTADGETVKRRAVTSVIDGLDFPVVWICTEEDWLEMQSNGSGNGHRPDGAVPWPAEDVEPAP